MESRPNPKYYSLSIPVLIFVIFTLNLIPGKSYYFQKNKQNSIDHKIFTELLKKHVNNKGQVSYQGFKADETQLNKYLKSLEQNPPNSTWSEKERLAYWINAYNAFTIKLVIKHYPISSIKDIGSPIQIPFINSPWDISFIEIGEEILTLNDIEHRILRKEFDEPRIHFAIVCASISCPRLGREAYTALRLDDQLNEQAIQFINDQTKNEIEADRIRISKIFKWFGGDFTDNGTLIEYLNRFSNTKISPEANINYLDYDWGLNGSSTTKL